MDRLRRADDQSPKVLIFNTEGNSLKFEVVVPQSPSPHVVQGRKLLSGVVEPIGDGAKLSLLETIEGRTPLMCQPKTMPLR